ncbi:hypothetical protein [Bradyrhizobium zhanjiangense]|uniref:Uncharacterized protein n=1 Tax=Bradyrhizobium zhanjiangense TaxID=1325107 RepID=A0A4Q0Q8R4_9BRAD|nr:hypothetical protein [Bradyrhizobium zhanjiangense]RXG85688.1 hypothetical protein EAS61_35500 [Bradyrhizobium zhanjiangense]
MEALPYLEDEEANDPDAALREIRQWYAANDPMFRFAGGRMLRSVFPTCTEEPAVTAARFPSDGDADDMTFLLEMLENYRGEAPLHIVAKAIVKMLPEDDKRLTSVEILLENTGVVTGEFGMVEAMRERKALMAA